MEIIPYEAKYADAVRQICLQVAGDETLNNPMQSAFVQLMYCDCYLEHGVVFLLLDEENSPRGYILCAPSFNEHSAYMIPYLKKIEALGEWYPLMAQAELSSYQKYSEDYPAHLHIDILEAFTGCGRGSALMNTLLAELRGRKIPGIMLQVSTQNLRAIRFYKKTGFRVLEENEHFLIMGQRL